MDLAIGTDRVRRAAIVVLATLLLAASVLLLLLLEDPPAQGSARVVVPLGDGAGSPGAALAALTEERDLLQADLTRARQEIETLQTGLSQRDQKLEEAEDRLDELALARTNLQTEVTDLIVARQKAEAQLDKALVERDAVSRQLEQARRERVSTQAALSETKAERQQLVDEVKALKFQVASLTASSGRAAGRRSSLSLRASSSVPGEQEPSSFVETTQPLVEMEAPNSSRSSQDTQDRSAIAPGIERSVGIGGEPGESAGDVLVANGPENEGSASARPVFRTAFLDHGSDPLGSGGVSNLVVGPFSGSSSVESADVSLISGALARGVQRYNSGDYKLAYDIWFPLAEQGVRRAQFYVGSLFHEGRGVGEDPIKAFYWLSLSDRAGYAKAGEVLESVEAVMSAAEIDAANKLLDTESN